MEKRKNIALLTALPESIHGRRIASGIISQCEKYGYNFCVFGAMTYLDFDGVSYKSGEENIFNLANFSKLDGIIIDTAQLNGDHSGRVVKSICERLRENPQVPAVSLELPLEDLPTIENRNEDILREMCRHVIEVHGKKKICILTGQKEISVSQSRLEVFLDEIGKHGLTVAPEHIIYGDFWYTSGDKLADDLLSGAVPMPEAVICAGDHMALGLIDKLDKNGVRIPEDLIVIGFEATDEAACNHITLSSYEANDTNSAADAVDYIRRIIEPDAPVIPYEADLSRKFHPAMSCGCEPDYLRSAQALKQALYLQSRNYADPDIMSKVDIGLLMESYTLEQFTVSQDVEECIGKIYDSTYLLKPFLNYYLCLTESWLDIDKEIISGYPENMKIVVAASSAGGPFFSTDESTALFDPELMFPDLFKESETPSIFYFSAVHFNGRTLGYSVLQRDIHNVFHMNLVYRNWLRFVNNTLEMIRNRKRLQTLSVRDEMTGLYNRRGMYAELDSMLAGAKEDSMLFVSVIDMDGLKYINDTFGHTEGDFGIKFVSSAIADVKRANEICIRAGGDEFYLMGVGNYKEDDLQCRIDEFVSLMSIKNNDHDKPYKVTASIGTALRKVDKDINVEDVICEADERMYQYKVSRKRQRQQ
ncbi:MAG: GGDEF domain-containing protein [Oscillospiraceae bacterium]|nr:GGDEF domain-containing protein [Oscillospiraceae bacterium]